MQTPRLVGVDAQAMYGADHRSFQMPLATLSLGNFITKYTTTCECSVILDHSPDVTQYCTTLQGGGWWELVAGRYTCFVARWVNQLFSCCFQRPRRSSDLHHCMVGRTPCRRNPRLAHAVANLLSPDDLLFGQNTGRPTLAVIVLRDGPLHQLPARPALPVLRQLTLMDGFARAVRARRA